MFFLRVKEQNIGGFYITKYIIYPCEKQKRRIDGLSLIEIEWSVELRKGQIIQLVIPEYDHIGWAKNVEFWRIDHIVHRSNKRIYSHTDIYISPN